jgi:penicillin-binding protein 2
MISQVASGFKIKNKIFFDNEPINKISLDIPKEHLDIVRKGCRLAFTHSQGTSRSGSEYQQKYEMAGKTGTAQVVSKRFTMAEMYSGKVPKNQMPHGLYVGYAPYSNPKFAVTAMIEHGMTGVAALRYAEKTIAKAMDLYNMSNN